MKILYISSVCSPKVLDYLFETSTIKPNQAVQKFHRLLIEGFAKYFDLVQVEVFTSLPVSPKGHKKTIWKIKSDKFNGIQFQYIPFINLSILKHITVFSISFLKVLVWILGNRKNQKVVLCDILNSSIVWGTFIACKICRQNMAVIVTDLPIPVLNFDVDSVWKRTTSKISSFILGKYDFYIGLTEQLNEVINPYKKPFLVMEGLVDNNIVLNREVPDNKDNKKIILYAGGIYEEFGVKKLLDAFVLLKGVDFELHIYGYGDLAKEMADYSAIDSRIIYHGLVKNSEIVNRLGMATILINPRPTSHRFTQFSFPSKNLEYMVSGTPLLTTKLPSMPIEYYDYVYLIEDESIEGISRELDKLLCKNDEELRQFGEKARSFVLKYKSNEMQAKRIIDFLMEK